MQLKVYVVEDNAAIRENLTGTLEELTCVQVVGVAATEDDGAAWLDRHPGEWDMAIIDLFLKGGSGSGLVQRAVRSLPHQKVRRRGRQWQRWRRGSEWR